MDYPRRKWMGAAAALIATPAWADLLRSPRMTEGPFYPFKLPLDHDNDLTRIAGRAAVAAGVLLDFGGRVLDPKGKPLAGAVVEIWQCDSNGSYHHVDGLGGDRLDANFQGFGKTQTDNQGRYRFRTIKPPPYPGRAPHIHYKVKPREGGELTSQVLFADELGNERDFVLRSMRSNEERARVLMPLRPAAKDSGAQLAGELEIVVG